MRTVWYQVAMTVIGGCLWWTMLDQGWPPWTVGLAGFGTGFYFTNALADYRDVQRRRYGWKP
jgi:hypothetical protein